MHLQKVLLADLQRAVQMQESYITHRRAMRGSAQCVDSALCQRRKCAGMLMLPNRVSGSKAEKLDVHWRERKVSVSAGRRAQVHTLRSTDGSSGESSPEVVLPVRTELVLATLAVLLSPLPAIVWSEASLSTFDEAVYMPGLGG